MIYVIGGTYDDYAQQCAQNEVDPETEALHVSTSADLRGQEITREDRVVWADGPPQQWADLEEVERVLRFARALGGVHGVRFES